MELRRRLRGHSHHHGDESGGVIVRPGLHELIAELWPGGRLFIAEFRPPRSRVGNHPIGFLTSHAMEHQHAINIEFLAEAAGFHVDELGEQRPLLHGMIADRPAS
jgi:hypothetical protein